MTQEKRDAMELRKVANKEKLHLRGSDYRNKRESLDLSQAELLRWLNETNASAFDYGPVNMSRLESGRGSELFLRKALDKFYGEKVSKVE